MINYLNHKLGNEFVRDPGLLPGLLMLIYVMICGAYIATLMRRSSDHHSIVACVPFELIMLLNCLLILAPFCVLSIVFEKCGANVADVSILHFIGITLVTLGYKKLLIK
jgi:hypothetical protein